MTEPESTTGVAPTRRSGPHAPLPTAPEAAAPIAAPDSPIDMALEDPRARAARRAAELIERGTLDEGIDKFYINPQLIPDGWSYEYKMYSVLGKVDPSYEVQLRQGGWEPVPLSRHPELMPPGYQGNTILREGQILMERPLVITEMRNKQNIEKARDQVRDKEEQLGAAPAGQFERSNKGEKLATIKKSYEVGIQDK